MKAHRFRPFVALNPHCINMAFFSAIGMIFLSKYCWTVIFSMDELFSAITICRVRSLSCSWSGFACHWMWWKITVKPWEKCSTLFWNRIEPTVAVDHSDPVCATSIFLHCTLFGNTLKKRWGERAILLVRVHNLIGLPLHLQLFNIPPAGTCRRCDTRSTTLFHPWLVILIYPEPF